MWINVMYRGCESLQKLNMQNNDALRLKMCIHVVFVINAVLVRTAVDVLHHPLSFCCSLLQSLCPQYHRGHYPLSLVLHLSCPRGFSLCVPSLCSTPAQVLRSLRSPSLLLAVSVSPSCFFVFVSLFVWEKKQQNVHILHSGIF